MNRSLVVGLVAGIGAATAVGAIAGYQRYSAERFADVVAVKPATKVVKDPRQECRDEQVVKQAPVKDERQVAGTVAGALVGGILGHQIGGGSGKTVATVAGAAAGGYAGNRVQKRLQDRDTVTTVERRCVTVYDRREQQVGYDVTYVYQGRTTTVRMDRDPGAKLPVRDGQVVLAQDAAKS